MSVRILPVPTSRPVALELVEVRVFVLGMKYPSLICMRTLTTMGNYGGNVLERTLYPAFEVDTRDLYLSRNFLVTRANLKG